MMNLRLHDVCRVIRVCFGQRMTLAQGCVSDTLPWGSNPASPPAGRQDGGCWVPFTCQAALVRCDVQTAGAGGGWPLTL